jgi:hypothetical protein
MRRCEAANKELFTMQKTGSDVHVPLLNMDKWEKLKFLTRKAVDFSRIPYTGFAGM